jgi:hypothetical protein
VVRYATTPDPIAFVFIPARIQVAEPAPDEHDRVFAAAVAAGPVVIETSEVCAGA